MGGPLIVVPARWGSTRLPGKPLVRIAGRTLLERVLRVADRSAAVAGDCSIVVATDDVRVLAHARALGHQAMLTDKSIASGSDRALAAARMMPIAPTMIVNLQGDAPFVTPEAVLALIDAVRSGAAVATAVSALAWSELDAFRAHKRTSTYSGTTCIRGVDGNAHWFSKQVIPMIRDEAALRDTTDVSPILRHLGLYCYTMEALICFNSAAPSVHERLEGLEQLRFFDLGILIKAELVVSPLIAMSGIDTEEDVARAEILIAEYGDPF